MTGEQQSGRACVGNRFAPALKVLNRAEVKSVVATEGWMSSVTEKQNPDTRLLSWPQWTGLTGSAISGL